ncbi:hypothetical protein HanPI659440_Chr12g0455481 [Helianthus annuus]|uniref:Uncharacterized protein n=1 Tax=Helianthus annuus TaxID=4232 RepID=A0A9K3MVE3_HELAN|nr:hypothetical protein HanXRQr2_Chr12g0535261 [Helianthus annuus]KAJ0492598.1 hypothetical protein HanIR_Chr12g0576681 [Helianthus annuus]KAJ0504818.1 hypothetical protein HanHA89_Chr12g0463521 [Helianthus annuus]KAJ0725145.1 hypothetical protein HanPI659440_Chr12g0455481 [Helianthus annuus]KAJ0862222.1 hypothetical protein HanPSC8_Chr12g0515591 [Helianthus annuus]
MTGKAKPKKHTAKEIQAKVDAATTNSGGGKAGIVDRTGQSGALGGIGNLQHSCLLVKTLVKQSEEEQFAIP